MTSITKNSKNMNLVTIFVAAFLVVTFVTASLDNNMAFASKKKQKSNDADQAIDQDQDSEQEPQCVSGEDAIVSCNDVGLFFQDQEGNVALGQR